MGQKRSTDRTAEGFVRHQNPEKDKGFVPAACTLIFNLDISDGALRLYLALCSYAWKRRGETARAFPGQVRLAGDMGVNVRTIQRHLKELEHKRFIVIERPQKDGVNNYVILDPPAQQNPPVADSSVDPSDSGGSGDGDIDVPENTREEGNGDVQVGDKNVAVPESRTGGQATGMSGAPPTFASDAHATTASHELDAVEVDASLNKNPCGSPPLASQPRVGIGSKEPEALKPKTPPPFVATEAELREWPRFSRFYREHPINDNQKPAFLEWMKQPPSDAELEEAILPDLKRRKKEHPHFTGGGQKDFRRGFKFPDTYLRDRAWDRGEEDAGKPIRTRKPATLAPGDARWERETRPLEEPSIEPHAGMTEAEMAAWRLRNQEELSRAAEAIKAQFGGRIGLFGEKANGGAMGGERGNPAQPQASETTDGEGGQEKPGDHRPGGVADPPGVREPGVPDEGPPARAGP